MATSNEVMQKGAKVPGPFYVFELPVRIWHWLHVFSIGTLIFTGFLIATPPPTLHGEASDHFIMGYVRMVHFSAAFVFAIAWIVRVYWAFAGNRYSRELFVVPVWRAGFWRHCWHELKFYLFLTRGMRKFIGHNPLAQLAMWVTNVALVVFMICTGFALYSQGLGDGSWADKMFGWVFTLVPSSQTVRMWHLFGMWIMLTFVIIHIYMVIREDVYSRQNGAGAMISGWRRFRDDGPMDPQ
ncbi:MAG: Ni/Fe-hydrogenase, b-type cytochrome subunit [Woeseiaceae bacterium]|nr:Ni/Fe-hydrogenase, b-type cytochrome subunit [Woeseiaceae bacterium]